MSRTQADLDSLVREVGTALSPPSGRREAGGAAGQLGPDAQAPGAGADRGASAAPPGALGLPEPRSVRRNGDARWAWKEAEMAALQAHEALGCRKWTSQKRGRLQVPKP